MKPGDLIESKRAQGGIALLLRILSDGRIGELMWLDTKEIECAPLSTFIVISEEEN